MKFTSHGEVVVIAQKERSAEGIERLSVNVPDTGEGMKSSETRSLFNWFSRANESADEKHGGIGLELIIAKKYANLLGGDLDSISSKKVLATFFVLFYQT